MELRDDYLLRFKLLKEHGIEYSFDPDTLTLEEMEREYKNLIYRY